MSTLRILVCVTQCLSDAHLSMSHAARQLNVNSMAASSIEQHFKLAAVHMAHAHDDMYAPCILSLVLLPVHDF